MRYIGDIGQKDSKGEVVGYIPSYEATSLVEFHQARLTGEISRSFLNLQDNCFSLSVPYMGNQKMYASFLDVYRKKPAYETNQYALRGYLKDDDLFSMVGGAYPELRELEILVLPNMLAEVEETPRFFGETPDVASEVMIRNLKAVSFYYDAYQEEDGFPSSLLYRILSG